MQFSTKWKLLFATTLVGAATVANAVPLHYRGDFTSLNDSGVTGGAFLTLNKNDLRVQIHATGLEPGQLHVQHIHGLLGGGVKPIDSTTPTLANDTDGDGFIELAEGAQTYGPILIALTPFSTTPKGAINYDQTFDLTDSAVFQAGYDINSLLPLTFREIVIHGMTLNAGDGADGGEADGSAGYKAVLPVASAEISAVPEPGVLALLGIGLTGLLGMKRRS